MEKREQKQTWKRTGKTTQELSFNKKGTIHLAEEVTTSGKRATRLVQTGYTSNWAKKAIEC